MTAARQHTAKEDSRHNRVRHAAAIVIPIVLVVFAFWLLHHELRHYKLHDILDEVSRISPSRIGLACGVTLIAYILLAGYDWLGFQYIRHPLALHKIASAAFISYAISYNLGHTVITGGSVRYRLYSGWGLPAQDVAKVVVFCMLTFWVGVSAIAGVAFLSETHTIALALHVPAVLVKPLGISLLVIVGSYMLWTGLRKKPIHIRALTLETPPVWISFAQIVVTIVDLTLAGTVLYILLPTDLGLSFTAVIGIYLIAVVIGLASQVPGGLGVFETVFFHLLPGSTSSTQVAGALLAYRGIYYLMPLALASLMLGAHELQFRFRKVPEVGEAAARWFSAFAPQALAVITFVSGAVLLFSGSMPGVSSRLHSLTRYLPLPVLEVSHLAGSVAGAVLIVLAHGIQRRLDGAYRMTLFFLGIGILASLLKGLDYEAALVLAVLLIALWPCRHYFYRRAALLEEPLSTGWLVAMGVVLACSMWIGLFSYKHLDYSSNMWWHFALTADAPRFLRASLAVVSVLLLVGLCRLLMPRRPEPDEPSPELLAEISPIVATCPETAANLAMLGDKSILLNDKRNAFIMYAVKGRSWVALGGPIGPAEERIDLVWRFRELVDRHSGWTVFYQIGSDDLYFYLDLGLAFLKLGEEARVPLTSFSLEGGARKRLRNEKSRAERNGCTFEVLPADSTSTLLPVLQEISDQWLAEKTAQEKGFSLGFYQPAYVSRYPVALVRKNGSIVAFATVWKGADKAELSVDLMRYRPHAPPGMMDYLLVCLMLWGQGQGFGHFNLGMAPLSGFISHPLAPLWNRLGGFIYRHGEHFDNFEGLREYKEKFDPEWTPKYLAAPGGLALPKILLDLTALINGSVRGALAK